RPTGVCLGWPWRRWTNPKRKSAPSSRAITTTAEWRPGGDPQSGPSRRPGATSRFVGWQLPENEYLCQWAGNSLWLVDAYRSGVPAWHAGRAGRVDDGPRAAGTHQPADTPRASPGERRRGNC